MRGPGLRDILQCGRQISRPGKFVHMLGENVMNEQRLAVNRRRFLECFSAAGLGLINIQDLAWTRPDELGGRRRPHDLERLDHDRNRIHAGIGYAAREHGDIARSAS